MTTRERIVIEYIDLQHLKREVPRQQQLLQNMLIFLMIRQSRTNIPAEKQPSLILFLPNSMIKFRGNTINYGWVKEAPQAIDTTERSRIRCLTHHHLQHKHQTALIAPQNQRTTFLAKQRVEMRTFANPPAKDLIVAKQKPLGTLRHKSVGNFTQKAT